MSRRCLLLLFSTFYAAPDAENGEVYHPHAGGSHAQAIDMINMLFASIARFNSPARFAIITSGSTDLSGIRHNFRRLDTPVRLETLMLDRTIGQRRQIDRLGHGETVAFLDTDILVQDDLSELGRRDFDVAVTTRVGDLPINGGVLFARKNGSGASLRFFDQLIDRCRVGYPDDLQWNCDQLALRDLVPLAGDAVSEVTVATEDNVRLALLSSSRFNHSPNYVASSYARVIPSVSIVHFKGRRKVFMSDYFQMLTGSEAMSAPRTEDDREIELAGAAVSA